VANKNKIEIRNRMLAKFIDLKEIKITSILKLTIPIIKVSFRRVYKSWSITRVLNFKMSVFFFN
jgi:hypothetical protein